MTIWIRQILVREKNISVIYDTVLPTNNETSDLIVQNLHCFFLYFPAAVKLFYFLQKTFNKQLKTEYLIQPRNRHILRVSGRLYSHILGG